MKTTDLFLLTGTLFYAYISCFLPEAASLYKFGIKSPETAKTGRHSKEYHPNA